MNDSIATPVNMCTSALVPQFSLTAPALREVVDQIADDAMSGLDQVTSAMETAPADIVTLLAGLRELFSSIGHSADATANDTGADLDEAWARAA